MFLTKYNGQLKSPNFKNCPSIIMNWWLPK
jgi:hypothetical protein